MYLVPPILVAIPGVGNTTITFSHYPSLTIFCPCSELPLLKFSRNHLTYSWPFTIGSNDMYPLTSKQGFVFCALKFQIGRMSYSCMDGLTSVQLDMLSMAVLTRQVLTSQNPRSDVYQYSTRSRCVCKYSQFQIYLHTHLDFVRWVFFFNAFRNPPCRRDYPSDLWDA